MLDPESHRLRRPGTEIHFPEHWFNADIMYFYKLRERLERNWVTYLDVCEESNNSILPALYRRVASAPADIPFRQPNASELIWLELFLEEGNFEVYCKEEKISPEERVKLRIKAQMLLGQEIELTDEQEELVALCQLSLEEGTSVPLNSYLMGY